MMDAIECKDFEQLTDILGSLFIKYRNDEDVLKLSEWVDEIVIKTQKQRQEIYKITNI
ncbi:MAG: hypothetical protein ACRC0V_01755 [Fusobacteriaceae bacterium]|uniref:hypothetical protein n=1 Tax=Romboutsia sp. TaxID=1965302 RepID=UPI003F3C59A2